MAAYSIGTGYLVYNNASNFPNAETPKTISLWLKLSTVSGVQGWLNFINDTLGVGYQIGIRNNSYYYWYYGSTRMIESPAPTDAEWHHVVFTYDRPDLYSCATSLYVDGVLVATSTAAYIQTGKITTLQICGSQFNEPAMGKIDDVRLYSRVLSQSEIMTMYTLRGVDGIVSDLVFRELFNEGAVGSTITSLCDVYGLKTASIVNNAPTFTDSILHFTRGLIR